MIKSVTITNYLGDSITLDIARPDLSGFVVESITGLGPGKATINTTEIATNDGGLFNSARLSKRNIVISLKFYYFMPNKSIEDLRQITYKYFPIKKPLKLTIKTDNRLAEITGFVETNDPNIFSQTEGSEISIICPDPYFYSAGEGSTNISVFAGVEPAFEFPFSNESLTNPLIEFGIIQNRTENIVKYTGDAQIGIVIRIHSIGSASDIVIYNIQTRESMTINTEKLALITGEPIHYGDDIVIVTTQGKKSIILIRDGITTNILNCIDKDSDWFYLTKGDNIFAYTASEGAANLQFTIENKIIYEGI